MAQVFFLPILGAIADYSHRRKQMMQLFATIGAIATILMFFVTAPLWWLGGVLFIFANLAFGASIVFYNSYLPDIARRTSVTGSLLMAGRWATWVTGCCWSSTWCCICSGPKMGIPKDLAIRINLASAGVWWLSFSFFTWTRLRTRHAAKQLPKGETYARVGFRQLWSTLREDEEFPRDAQIPAGLFPL